MNELWHPQLGESELKWQQKAQALAAQAFAPLADEIDRDQRYPVEHLPRLLDAKISGMFVPKAYGGEGASLTAVVAVVEAVAQGCASTSAILAALALGAFPILLAGSEAQKQALLGGLAQRGDAVNFALSEREAGSDPSAIQTVAVREGDGWRIRGEKCWLGNGGHSQHFIVFARTGGAAARKAVSAFVVPRDTDGLVVDFYEDKMGIRGTTTTNLKLDVRVPADSLVGAEGDGLKLALATLTVGRVVVAAQANGIALCAYDSARRYAVTRNTFGHPLIDHQGVGFKLADAAMNLSAARMFTYEAARAYDQGRDIGTLGAMAKLYASEVSHDVVDDAVQILGGRGYVKPNVVERCYRDQRIVEIYEGTSEIQRVVLARAVKKGALADIEAAK
ncbi:acyl-CoA dehydrogenase family protein [Cupriavidus taiwanensis]|uniref:3-sulfinopropanoyl-CoA desulfinase n=1 Tax=Cupriavidus taiwanensis TaxID=164546 RepID=A0A975X4S7_9BURK|nr:putative ACYL COA DEHYDROGENASE OXIDOREDUCTASE PROTEIN [Cupriavidus taiwanensis]